MPENFGIKIVGMNELIADFKKAGANFEPLLKQAMEKSTGRLQNEVRENLTANRTSNTGNLRRSVQGKAESAYKGIVGVGEKYGRYVEKGTKPHFPPVDAIERWAKTKLGQPGLGFVIARKISIKGTKAQPFVEPAYKNATYVIQYFRDAVDQVVKMMAKG